MFAVPGWSVSASSLKRQTEADIKPTAAQIAKASKKRKRKSGAPNVTDENVSNLWAHKFEGARLPAAEKPQAKAAKQDSEPVAASEPVAVKEQITEAATQDKPVQATQDKPKSKHENEAGKKSKQDKPGKNGPPAAKAPPAPPPVPAAVKLTPMQQKMREKLVSARFRHLNETLYTAPSGTSLSMFADNPSMFEDYHSGFRRQVEVWPENPVDTFTRAIEVRAKVRARPQFRKSKTAAVSEANGGAAEVEMLPRTAGTCTIADLGCGDAALARKLTTSGVVGKRALKVLSYDLAAGNEYVTKADVAKLPLRDGSVDVAIFCLALMGTNWIDFVEEAYRVLHWKGELWVAEIKSRFARQDGKKGQVVDHSVGKRRKVMAGNKEPKKTRQEEEGEDSQLRQEVDGEEARHDTQVDAFVKVLERRGFLLRKGNQSIDLANKMFVRMEFIKAAPATVGKNVKATAAVAETGPAKGKKFLDKPEEVSREDEGAVLKPCLYKVR